MKLVGICKPFSPTFNFVIYDDDNMLVTELSCAFDNFTETVLTATSQYNITKVMLVGPKQYNTQLKNYIETAELAKYDKNSLEIELI